MKRKAYAKANLMLRVIAKDSSGYHQLQMINTKIHIYDIIKLSKAKKNQVIFKKIKNISPEFILKVIQQFNDIYNIKEKYKITIYKKIPVGSGLGGGSADAATIINMLYEYNNIEESIENKITYFKNLGADIPYMFFNSPAIVEGVGEKIYMIEKINLDNYLFIYPNIDVSTKKVFEMNNKYSDKISHEKINEYIYKEKDMFQNDLEEAAFKIYPELKQVKEKLDKYGKVWMSGSGSTFIIYVNEKKNKVKKEIKKEIKNAKIF